MNSKKFSSIKVFLLLFFIIFVIMPVLVLLSHITGADFKNLTSSPKFITAIKNSVCVAGISTILSLLLSLLLAWCITHRDVKFNNFFSGFLTLPMLVPSMSHGMGLIILLGTNGILSNLFHLNHNIYGFGGIIIGSVLYSFPVAFIMILDIFQYEDIAPYEAASVLGIPKFNQFLKITLPYLKKPLFSVTFAIFTLVITDYGVPIMVGGNYITLPVMMYQEVIGLLNFGTGAIISVILLIPAFLAFLVDLFSKESKKTGKTRKSNRFERNQKVDILSLVLCTIISILVLLPILSFILLTFVKKYPVDITFTFKNIMQTFQMNGIEYFLNSLIISIATGLLGCTFSFITAYMSARTDGKLSKLLHLSALVSLSIPGIVLGLCYCLLFNSSWFYGTLLILIMVNTIHFFSSPYLMIYNSIKKLNSNLESVSMVLGIPRFKLIKDVILPQTSYTLLEMFGYFFINGMMTISAVSFLATLQNKPIALMITQFESQMLMECAAFVSLLILAANLLLKGFIYFIKQKIYNKENTPYAHQETI